MSDEIQVKLGRGKSIDDALLEGAVLGLSAEEISQRINGVLSPARVMVKTREMLRGGDWLEDAERELAILRMLNKNLVELHQMALDTDGAKIQLAYAKELMDRLAKRRSAVESDLMTYNANVGAVLGHAAFLIATHIRGALRDKIEPEEFDNLVLDSVAVAQVEIERHQVEA